MWKIFLVALGFFVAVSVCAAEESLRISNNGRIKLLVLPAGWSEQKLPPSTFRFYGKSGNPSATIGVGTFAGALRRDEAAQLKKVLAASPRALAQEEGAFLDKALTESILMGLPSKYATMTVDGERVLTARRDGTLSCCQPMMRAGEHVGDAMVALKVKSYAVYIPVTDPDGRLRLQEVSYRANPDLYDKDSPAVVKSFSQMQLTK